MNQNRYKELDSLRGLSALFVVLFHLTLDREQAALGFNLGITGVDLFFMISGFVIILTINHVKKPIHFFFNRISRLYPTYWISVSVSFLFLIAHGFYSGDYANISFVQYLANMTMFQFYLNVPNLEGAYWTMVIEILFYFFIFFIYQHNLIKHLLTIGFILMIAIVLVQHLSGGNNWIKVLFWWIPILQFWPLFFSGIVFYCITKKRNVKYYLLLVLCLLSQISLFNYSGQYRNYISFWKYAFMLTFYFSLFSLFVAGKLKLLINKPLLFFGKISFPLYLTHQMVSTVFIIPFLNSVLNINFWLSATISLLFSLSLATLITYFIEIPFSEKMKIKLYSYLV